MKRCLLFTFFIFLLNNGNSQNLNDSVYRFLQLQNVSAKDYVIKLFKKYDIVILCERSHKEFTQYELFKSIISDPYFIAKVGHVFTELGAVNMDKPINKFLHSNYSNSETTSNAFLNVYRNIVDQPYWEPYSFPWFVNEIYKVNRMLPTSKKIMIHPSDEAFEWSKIHKAKDLQLYQENRGYRDSVMANNIISKFNNMKDQRRKALVIMNYKHAFLKSHIWSDDTLHNTGEILYNYYKNRVASVYIMGLAIPVKNQYGLIKDGKWDYFFSKLNKNDFGFDLYNTPMGESDFDVIPPVWNGKYQYKFSDMFTGIIYYKPVTEHYFKTGWKGFCDDQFLPVLRKRAKLFVTANNMQMSDEEFEKLVNAHDIIDSTSYPNIRTIKSKISKWEEK